MVPLEHLVFPDGMSLHTLSNGNYMLIRRVSQSESQIIVLTRNDLGMLSEQFDRIWNDTEGL